MEKNLIGPSQQKRLRRVKSSNIMLTEKEKKELKNLKKRPIDTSDKDAIEITNRSNAVVGKLYRP